VSDLLVQALNGENELAISYLRQVVFSPRWGGYQENQVDAYIDKAVEFLQLSRGIL
jgi:DivIVA domain-containing protein